MNRNLNETPQGGSVPGALAGAVGAVGGNVGKTVYKVILGGAIVLGLCSMPFVAMQFIWADDTPTVAGTQRTIADDHGLRGQATVGEAERQCAAGQEPVGTVYADGSWAGWQCLPKR